MQKTTVFALAVAVLLAACASSAPDIDVPEMVDLGAVAKGELVVADLPVRNLGDGPLAVASVSTSCGCTTATLSPMTIPPGGEAVLHVEYDSGVHAEDVGAITRYIFIASDDPDEGDTRIEFTVFVEQASE